MPAVLQSTSKPVPITRWVIRSGEVYREVDEDGYERVILAELLIPDTPNCYGDIYTKEAIREFMYQFAAQGYGLDINHDNVDVQGAGMVVVESFIARPGDPNFIEGSWVIGLKILDDDIWEAVLSGELNGYSFEASCLMTPIVITNLADRQIVGVTMPDLVDGHAHGFLVILDPLNNVISGATDIADSHTHRIVRHTTTEESITSSGREHKHRYAVVVDNAKARTKEIS